MRIPSVISNFIGFLLEYWQELVVIVISLAIEAVLIHVDWHNRPISQEVLVSILLTALVTWIWNAKRKTALENVDLRQTHDSAAQERDELRQRYQEASEARDWQQTIIAGLQWWFGETNLPDIRSLAANTKCQPYSTVLHQRQLKMAEAFFELIRTGRKANASYQQQFGIADLLARLATKTLWATSADRLSEFQIKNHFYLETLEDIRRKFDLKSHANVPVVARVFIGTREEFLQEITGESTRSAVLDLYEWHIRWPGDARVNPLRFFVYADCPLNDVFRNCGIQGSEVIRDFMIVDEEFVYGRCDADYTGLVELGFEAAQTVVQKYVKLYPKIWEISVTMEELVKDLTLSTRADIRLGQFQEQCDKRKSKLLIEEQYQGVFDDTERRGNKFFKKVVRQIEKGQGACFAIDRADHKTTDIVEAWNKYPYSEFKRASKVAAKECVSFQRLFVIEDLFVCTPSNLREFVQEFTEAGVEIGFVLSTKTKISDLMLTYDTDFIITGYGRDDSFGFELQEAEFRPETLMWTRNLISRTWMKAQYELFNQLWHDSATTVLFTKQDRCSSDDDSRIRRLTISGREATSHA